MSSTEKQVQTIYTERNADGSEARPSFPQPIIQLGTVFQTPLVADLDFDRHHFLFRHSCGDWGEFMEESDDHVNEAAVFIGAPVISRFEVSSGVRVCIITNGGRTTTRIVHSREL